MPRHTPKAQSTERVSKKPKVETPPKLSANRVKGSPRPRAKAKKAPPEAGLHTPTVSIHVKDKGKEKEISTPTTLKSKAKKTGLDDDSPDVLPSTFMVIAGSYEKLLYGLEGSVTATDDNSELLFHLKPIFIFPAHVSCIKAVAASPNGGKWLATGSADEIVKVWDLRRRKEIGGLMHHEGSITHLNFPSQSHLLSASEDGTLCLFRARDWAVLRSLKGHKGRVSSVAVHPSGKVALSVGKDKTLRMWDLMRGKGSASTKLGKEGELVRWSTDGSLFVVQAQSTIDLYTTDMALLHTITHPSRLHDVKFCKRINDEGEVLFACAEDKKISIYDISSDPHKIPKIVAEMVGHSNRVKAVQTLSIALPPSSPGRTSTTIVSTVSSDGKIHIYDMASLPSAPSSSPNSPQNLIEIKPVAEYDSKGTRLTCVALADGEMEGTGGPVNGKRKRAEDGDEDAEASGKQGDDEEEDGDEAAWEDEVENEEEGEEEDEESD